LVEQGADSLGKEHLGQVMREAVCE